MIQKTLTSLLTQNTSLNMFYSINDTFIANSAIHFSCPLATLNTLASLTITSGNISSHKLYVRISNSIESFSISSILFDQNFTLNTSNIVNGNFLVNISSLTNKLGHDYLCENLTQQEIFNLLKSYKIIFRVYTGTLQNTGEILASDFVQDLNLVLNTGENGPYDVSLEEIDLVSPTTFTNSERIAIYQNYISIQGFERIRTFYPTNIEKNSSCPIFIFAHGNGQYTSAYDIYLAKLASYGYFCCSITNYLQGSVDGNATLFLDILDYLQLNLAKISNGKFVNLLNFNKINLSGHSRGGVSAICALQYIQNKQFIPKFANRSIDKSKIKSLVSFAHAHALTHYNNNIVFTLTNLNNFQITDIPKLNLYLDTPFLHIRGTNDGDSNDQWRTVHYGYCGDIKRNYHDMIFLEIANFYHGELAISTMAVDQYTSKRAIGYAPTYLAQSRLSQEFSVYNTNIPTLNDISAEMIYFIGTHNFNSNKIKKLYTQGIDLLDKKNIKSKPKSAIHRTIFNKNSDIKLTIDSFSGITMSFAGNTGMTISSSSLGYTYDYIIPQYYKLTSGNTYAKLHNQKIINTALDGNAFNAKFDIPAYSQPNAAFSGVIHGFDRGLYFPVESNRFMGYTFQSPLSLAENEYLCIRGALQVFYPRSSGNTLDSSFYITLFDTSNNGASLSSKISDQYFTKPYSYFKWGNNTSYNEFYSDITTYMDNIYFRAGDFALNNPNLNLSNIRQILFSFGPNFGSTFAHLCFDEFVVMKEF